MTTTDYTYDSRNRVDKINLGGTELADYTWVGGLLDRRDVTSAQSYTIGATTDKAVFKTEFDRDGILRVTKAENLLTTPDQDDYPNLGSWTYAYDSANNSTQAVHAGDSMNHLEATRYHTYDTLNRLITSRLTDTQDWTTASEVTTTYQYDDLGNRESHAYRDATAITYAHDKANRMTTLAAVSQLYDDAGNLTLGFSADRGTSYTYRYDHTNRLEAVYDSTDTTRKAAITYDALGRRIEVINDTLSTTTRYYYDGVNEVVEKNQSGTNERWYVHGVSYVDERLMMMDPDADGEPSYPRPYYYAIDRMYNVRAIVDRAGAIVERWAYDSYGRPLIRESAGRGDMDTDSDIDSTDLTRHAELLGDGALWDPRGDLNDDGDVDSADGTALVTKKGNWYPDASPTVAQAFSDVGNPFGWQGRVHFAFDTIASATDGQLMLVDHRLRFHDPFTGRWLTRDPIGYLAGTMNLYEYVSSNPRFWLDPSGLNRYYIRRLGHSYVGFDEYDENGEETGNIIWYDFAPTGHQGSTTQRIVSWFKVIISVVKRVNGQITKVTSERGVRLGDLDGSYYEKNSSREEDEATQGRVENEMKNPPDYGVAGKNCIGWAQCYFKDTPTKRKSDYYNPWSPNCGSNGGR